MGRRDGATARVPCRARSAVPEVVLQRVAGDVGRRLLDAVPERLLYRRIPKTTSLDLRLGPRDGAVDHDLEFNANATIGPSAKPAGLVSIETVFIRELLDAIAHASRHAGS